PGRACSPNGITSRGRGGPGPRREPAPFDMLLSNPPYVTADELRDLAVDVRNFEPHTALVTPGDGLDAYRHILDGVGALLGDNARVAFEVDPRRADGVEQLMREHVPHATRRRVRDLTDRDRVVEAATGA